MVSQPDCGSPILSEMSEIGLHFPNIPCKIHTSLKWSSEATSKRSKSRFPWQNMALHLGFRVSETLTYGTEG